MDKQRQLRAAQVRIRDLEKSRADWKARAAEGRTERSSVAEPNGGVATDAGELPPLCALTRPLDHRYSLLRNTLIFICSNPLAMARCAAAPSVFQETPPPS